VESPSIPAATGLPVLAVFGPRRLPSLPGVPTTAELGHPVEGTSAGGLVAPAGIPEPAFARLQSACERAVGSEGFRAAAERLNAVPSYLPGEAFRARFAAESEANRVLLRALDLARD
jgi:tripartite-type tricarboxylate transporter receptor subunit TctC